MKTLLLLCLFFNVCFFTGTSNNSYTITVRFAPTQIPTKYVAIYVKETGYFLLKVVNNNSVIFTDELPSSNSGLSIVAYLIPTNDQALSILDVKRKFAAIEKVTVVIERKVDIVFGNNLERSKVTGQLNQASQEFKRIDWKYMDLHQLYNRQIDSVNKIAVNAIDKKKISALHDAINNIRSIQINTSTFDKLNEQLKIIRAHPEAPIALIKLNLINKTPYVPVEIVKDAYNMLSDILRKTPLGIELKKNIAIRISNEAITLRKNERAPDFTLVNSDGKSFSLNQYFGKTVLIEFWASWCGPCRAEMPTLKSLENDGLTIIAVSLDTDKSKWIKAIKDDRLSDFVNLIDTNAFKSEIAKKYNIHFIPQNYLLDQTGKIIGRNLYGEKLKERFSSFKLEKR